MTARQPIDVSDHALLRILERAGGVDIEALRQAVAQSIARSVAAAELIGVTEYTVVADGFHYIVCNGRLVTVYPEPKR